MLVLSRTLNEAIVIAGCIRVQILAVRGDKVRLGIDCPRQIAVHREEIQTAVNTRAAELLQVLRHVGVSKLETVPA